MSRRSESPYRGRGGGGGGGGSSRGPDGVSLLVRNISYRTRAEDLRYIFSKYGDIRDVYLPMDYHSKEPRGFAFVEFYDGRDAADAKDALDRYALDNRQIAVVFAQQRRKRPEEMAHTEQQMMGGGWG
eukprot:CAMPEP_0113944974 /NCGR_PEP_ID=MMETSP1339-20121228/38407_1 /TAXON_ID=94617 /ORGANISM="Fibrocapsa japonica" /LENGTH=127 /DNA_ID=CAMNT_0000950353 /DNA_START=31 /DNA_END=410 /DNA_ORIENTATION=- /assembly_acc=CAM_ASM_000762